MPRQNLRFPLFAATALASTMALLLGSGVAASPGSGGSGGSGRLDGSAGTARSAPTDEIDHRGAGRVLVTFKEGARAEAVRDAHSRARGRSVRRLTAVRAEVVEVDDVAAALAEYRARGDVEWAGRDGKVRALHHVPDGEFEQQWNLHDLGNNPGSLNWHGIYRDGLGAGVTVAVVDSGIGRGFRGGFDGFEHEPFTGIDLVNRDTPPDDESGHGTHIAGTIAQRTGNALAANGGWSVAGVAPDARLMAVRVLDNEGEGLMSNTIEGVIYAADNGARVINLSLAGDFTRPMCDAVRYASERGALVVAASGNESEEGVLPVDYPAACPGAFAVGGHRWDAQRATYSNGSCELAVTAPGGDLSVDGRVGAARDPRNGILQEAVDNSATRYGFYYDSGTSMAAAHVAGAAAVLMAPPYNKTAAETARILRSTARDIGAPGPDHEYGFGAADLGAAVAAATRGDAPAPAERLGYWMVASDGGIFSFGDAPFFGSTGHIRLNSPIVAMAKTPSGRGYWMTAADGGVFTFGDARFFGSAGSLPLKAPVVGMAATPTGNGYWLVASDGGIFAYGDARFFGSTGGMRLNKPIIGMAGTRTGNGYWLVASDGGVFAFGEALFHGSTGNLRLNAPIVAVTRTPSGGGYWMVATDGGIFAFGDAPFHGSTGNLRLNKPIVGMISTCFGKGYWLVASDGGVFSFGSAPFLGSTGAITLNRPIVGALLATDHRGDQL